MQAIGEIGLDFFYDHSDRETQRYWFRRQIQLANELKMPIAIHSRDADQETLDILKEEGAFSKERQSWFPKRKGPGGEELPDSRVLLHCFSGSKELAKQYIKLGATLSICGPVTFKNNRRTQDVVREIPIEFLLVETDAPYLTPEPFRGKKNKSPYVEYTARKVADVYKRQPQCEPPGLRVAAIFVSFFYGNGYFPSRARAPFTSISIPQMMVSSSAAKLGLCRGYHWPPFFVHPTLK